VKIKYQVPSLTLLFKCRSGIGDDIDIVTSLQVIGENTATNFLVEMGGDIRKFRDHKKLIAMAGIDPAIYQSGKRDINFSDIPELESVCTK